MNERGSLVGQPSRSDPARVAVIFGTRPEAVKLAPVILELTRSPVLDPVVVVTAQHRKMLDQVLQTFDIKPAVDLDIIQTGQSLADITVRAVGRLSPWFERERPDVVVVQGDTTTTFAGALSAYYARIPVVHVEAGLRTYQRYSPFPEEINRRLTTQLADLHLAPTATAKAHLVAEAVPEDRVVLTGNTVIDALLWAVERQMPYGDPALDEIDDDGRRVVLVTAHRRESWGAAMTCIGEAVAEIARAEPDVLVVIPLHRNPIVRDAL